MTAGSGGNAGTSPGVPDDCGSQVKFRFVAPRGESAAFCRGKPGTCSGGNAWLAVYDSAGEGVWLGRSCGIADCAECVQTGCTADCPQSTLFSEEAVEQQWDGVRWTGGQTCGNGVQCATPACAAPGAYTARFCAFELDSGAGGDASFGVCEEHAAAEPTCVDVPFELPSTETVEGTLEVSP